MMTMTMTATTLTATRMMMMMMRQQQQHSDDVTKMTPQQCDDKGGHDATAMMTWPRCDDEDDTTMMKTTPR